MITTIPAAVSFYFCFTLDYRSVEASNLDDAITLMRGMKSAHSWDRSITIEIPCPAIGQIALDTVISGGGRVTRRNGSLVSLRDALGEKVTINLDFGEWWATGCTASEIRAALIRRSAEVTACLEGLCPGRRVFAYMGKFRVRLPGADDPAIDHLEGETAFDGRRE